MKAIHEKEGIYKLFNGDYMDLSKLVAIKVEYDGIILPDDEQWTTNGKWYMEGNFEFIKDPVKFFDTEKFLGNEHFEKREIFMNTNLQEVVKIWKNIKRQTNNE